MKIIKASCAYEREPLVAPFGFKGGYLSELWQSVVRLEGDTGGVIGLGTQSTLWSDVAVFAGNSEFDGNNMMFQTTAYAAKMAVGLIWDTPMDLLDQLLPLVYDYAKEVTHEPDLRLTFALNALVAVDNAAWLLYAKEKGLSSFDDIIPADAREALSFRHERLAGIPLMSYNVPLDKIAEAVNDGYFFLKIKIGSDPDKDGDLDKMLEWDRHRLKEIHKAVRDVETPYTESGHIPYYFDANGRYESKDRLQRFLDYAAEIGALDRIMILEEPFPEAYKTDVSDLPVRLAADESAHSDHDAIERIEMGYGAIALKPIAKTMSMSLKIARIAHERAVPCFCADLTVNPILIDWNKNVAARLAPLPGMKVGVVESNGHQNYKNWEAMKEYHPAYGEEWTECRDGLYRTGPDFFARSGGIFEVSDHYRSLA